MHVITTKLCRVFCTDINYFKTTDRSKYLEENSGQKSAYDKDVVVGGEGVGDADNDQCPVTIEEDGFTTKLVRQNGAE